MKKTYVKTVLSTREAIERLEGLKASLGQEAVDELQAQYKASGNEQFLENTENVKCTACSLAQSIECAP